MKTLTPVKAIRAKCRDCCNDQVAEVRTCPIQDCPLHPYHMGVRPQTLRKRENRQLPRDSADNQTIAESAHRVCLHTKQTAT